MTWYKQADTPTSAVSVISDESYHASVSALSDHPPNYPQSSTTSEPGLSSEESSKSLYSPGQPIAEGEVGEDSEGAPSSSSSVESDEGTDLSTSAPSPAASPRSLRSDSGVDKSVVDTRSEVGEPDMEDTASNDGPSSPANLASPVTKAEGGFVQASELQQLVPDRKRRTHRGQDRGQSSPNAQGLETKHNKKSPNRGGSEGPQRHVSAPSNNKTSAGAVTRQKQTQSRTRQQELIRLAALYLVPTSLAIPVSLLLHLTQQILIPLYNSLPLTLHLRLLYSFLTFFPAILYWAYTLNTQARKIVSAQVCFSIAAISGDLVVVFGRRVGSLCGKFLGPEWGALMAMSLLGVGVVGGAMAFALLCFDYVSPIRTPVTVAGKVSNLAYISIRSVFFMAHIYYATRLWGVLLSRDTSILSQRPEKTMMFISLLLTGLSLFVRPGSTTTTVAKKVHSIISSRLSLRREARSQLAEVTSFLPRQIFPVLLLFRLPLLVLALRQQIYLRPSPPYTAVQGALRILHSERSVAGQVVVGEDVSRGCRFMRVDASLIGGRWFGQTENGTRWGDSIFSAFPMQEIGVLAIRADGDESLARTISMTTELQVEEEVDDQGGEDKLQERALVVGLGAGITAGAMSRRGLAVDVVEIDAVVYQTAKAYFDLSLPADSSTINLLPVESYISQIASYDRESNGTLQKWSYVIHDCFSAGSLPVEAYSKDFWEDVRELVEVDGIVSVNIAGTLGSLVSRRIIVTLLSVFTQCRAFGDVEQKDLSPKDLLNMVVLCTMAYSPILSFREPTKFDVLRSPLRSHVYTTFHSKEIQLDSIVTEADWENPEMILSSNSSIDMSLSQKETSLPYWRAMQHLLPREMWMVW